MVISAVESYGRWITYYMKCPKQDLKNFRSFRCLKTSYVINIWNGPFFQLDSEHGGFQIFQTFKSGDFRLKSRWSILWPKMKFLDFGALQIKMLMPSHDKILEAVFRAFHITSRFEWVIPLLISWTISKSPFIESIYFPSEVYLATRRLQYPSAT